MTNYKALQSWQCYLLTGGTTGMPGIKLPIGNDFLHFIRLVTSSKVTDFYWPLALTLYEV